MSLNNILTYSLQIGLLIGVAGWIPAAARLRSPRARLAFFHALLAACLLLPALRPWKSEVIAIEAPSGRAARCIRFHHGRRRPRQQ